MLLETFIYHHPDAQLASFDYRAVNPLTVNNTVTINGAWVDDKSVKLWVVKDLDSVVCMTGVINVL
jgi:hydroxyacyl-ACP dehydratase HTD2-like protein with hotdog domain